MIRNILLATLILFVSIFKTNAQNTTDSLYFQLFGGLNKSANENMQISEFSMHPISVGGFVGIGKEFTSLLGWRGIIGFNHNKSRNVPICENNDTWGWNDIELFCDGTFDVTDAFFNKKKNNKLNIKAFVSVGALYTFSFPQQTPLSYTYPYSHDSKVNLGFRAGLFATYRISQSLKLGFELSNTFVQDQFNGVSDKKTPIDSRTNMSIGLQWTLKGKKNKRRNGNIIYANRLKEIPSLPMRIPNKEINKTRLLAGKAYLDFPVNETTVYPSYRNNPSELNRIKQSIEHIRFDKSVIIKTINLHGYASPESPYSNNVRLAKGRTEALISYLKNEYGLINVQYITNYTPEDWGNLRTYITDSITIKNPSLSIWKNELLKVIDENIDLDEKEEKLKKINNGIPYQWLYKHVYPALRHTDYIVTYNIKEYPISDGRRLIYTHPEALSLEEMYQVANSYPEESEGYFEALIIASKQYPNNEIANLNAACACIKRRKLKDARLLISKLPKSQNSKYLINIVDAMEGKIKWQIINNKLVMNENN